MVNILNFEAKVLDVALVLHAEHGGGNNSTFTTHVVTSSGTDTYSTVAASVASLKGPKHGGANLKVKRMFDDIKEHVSDWEDEDALREYLQKILISRLSTMPDLFTVSDMRYIHYQTRVRLFLRNMPSVCLRRRVLSKSLSFMTGLRE